MESGQKRRRTGMSFVEPPDRSAAAPRSGTVKRAKRLPVSIARPEPVATRQEAVAMLAVEVPAASRMAGESMHFQSTIQRRVNPVTVRREMKQHGLTYEQYVDLVQLHGGVCSGCGRRATLQVQGVEGGFRLVCVGRRRCT